MMEEGVDENDLSYIFNYTDEMKLGDQIIKLPAPDNFSTTTYRKGFSGELNGVRTMFTNQLPVLTVGTRAASAALWLTMPPSAVCRMSIIPRSPRPAPRTVCT
jgi:hypothetical protein